MNEFAQSRPWGSFIESFSLDQTVFWILMLLSFVLAAISVWLCYRRTRVVAFLYLGAVTLLWPPFQSVTDTLLKHLVKGQMHDQLPFSVVPSTSPSAMDWFNTAARVSLLCFRLTWTRTILQYSLCAIAFALLARAFKKAPAQAATPPAD